MNDSKKYCTLPSGREVSGHQSVRLLQGESGEIMQDITDEMKTTLDFHERITMESI